MRVGIYPADAGGCGHYRLIWPGEAAARAGADVTIVPHDHADARFMAVVQDRYVAAPGRKGTPVPEAVDLIEAPPYDVVVIQRPLHSSLATLIPHIRAAGVAVVVELDDDFWSLAPQNTVWPGVHPRSSPASNWDHLAFAIGCADLVTVSTPALARKVSRWARHAPVVLPNYLPPHAYRVDVKPISDPPVIGWSGSLATHPGDLREVGAAVADVMRRTGATFHVVGTGQGVARQLGIADVSTSGGWLPLDQYHAALDAIHIGIVPLKAIPFNHAKSWLKGIEMAARNIPVVASPVEEYRTLHRDGGCLVAHSTRSWSSTLRTLIEDAQWRAHTAERGRQVADALHIDRHAHLWPEAWALARALRLADA